MSKRGKNIVLLGVTYTAKLACNPRVLWNLKEENKWDKYKYNFSKNLRPFSFISKENVDYRRSILDEFIWSYPIPVFIPNYK